MSPDKNFDSLKSARQFVRKTQSRALISGLIVGSLLAFFWSGSVGFGFLSGAAIGIVNFQLMSADAYKIVEKEPQKAKKFIMGRLILRYAIMFGFLALIVIRTDFNIIATFIGLFYIKLMIVGVQILNGLNLTGKASGGY